VWYSSALSAGCKPALIEEFVVHPSRTSPSCAVFMPSGSTPANHPLPYPALPSGA
jgi:hypothetical protein